MAGANGSVVSDFEVGTPTTGNEIGGAHGIGDINAIASQVNNGVVLSSGVSTQGGGFTTTTTLTVTPAIPGDPPVSGTRTLGDPVVTPGEGASPVRLTLELGATTGSTARVLTNAVNSLTTDNAATRTLNLDLVSGALPTALLGLSQTNRG